MISKPWCVNCRCQLVARTGPVRVEISNGRSLGLVERLITEPAGTTEPAEPGDLYVLAVGVNHFTQLDPGVALSYAARDAEEVAAMLRRWVPGDFARFACRRCRTLGRCRHKPRFAPCSRTLPMCVATIP